MSGLIVKRPNHKYRNEYVNMHSKTIKEELPERGQTFS